MIQIKQPIIDSQNAIDNPNSIDVKNLCSRKLWEILTCIDATALSAQQKNSIEAELRERRHYLPELQFRQQNTL